MSLNIENNDILSYIYCNQNPKTSDTMNKLATFLFSAVGAFTALSATDITETVPDTVTDPKTLIASLISIIGAVASQLLVSFLRKALKLDKKKQPENPPQAQG